MRTQGSAQELERQRFRAQALLQDGLGPTEIARRLGVSHTAVGRWKRLLERHGPDGLKAKPHPGPKPKLTVRQRLQPGL